MDKNKLEDNKEIKEENIPEFSSLEELDPKLFNLIKDFKIDIPDFSESIKRNVMADYRKYYRYGIFWRKIKIKLRDLKDFIYEHLPGKLELVFASVALLAILGGIAYYQYGNSKGINQGKLSSNQQPPKMNTTVKPIANIPTPSPNPSVSPNIANKSNKTNKSDYIQKGSSDKDNVKVPNNENHKFDNEVGHNQSLIPPIETISKDGLRGEIKDLSLLEITNFYVASFGEEQENKELTQALVNRLKNTEFRVLTASEALSEDEYGEIKRNGQSIQIISGTNKKLLWQMSIDGNNSSPKELADKIITQLLLDLKNK